MSRFMNVGMVLFPGSNCEQETLAFLSKAYGSTHVTELWHRDRFDPKTYDLIFLPGGFSYGDYVRAGACAARSPVMQDVVQVAKRGAYVLGVCNGFQTLLECGMLPGVLMPNTKRRFECRWVKIHVNPQTKLSWTIPSKQPYTLPIANTYGRYYLPKNYSLKDEGQIVMTYSDSDNNGSQDNIAGLTNERGNVLGMMPHPERAFTRWHHSEDGRHLLPDVEVSTWA